jgi:hypothetical protein
MSRICTVAATLDFSLWGLMKDDEYIPPLLTALCEKQHVKEVVNMVD